MSTRSTLRVILGVVLYGALLFGSAGTLRWLEGWVFLAILLGATAGTGLWLQRHDPALLAERTKPLLQPGQPLWDRIIMIAFVPAWIAWFVVPGLDAVRFGWSSVGWPLKAMGAVLHIVGWAGIVWTLKANTFLAPVVRVQTEREQRVIDSGPYALVRHPMYVAVFVWLIGGSLFLGSWWGVLSCAWPIALLVVRTALEDRHLHEELAGYPEYAARVRYRLLPGLW